jgi:hypothetical protein
MTYDLPQKFLDFN